MAWNPTPEQRANLARLAEHLAQIPDDDPGFCMNTYCAGPVGPDLPQNGGMIFGISGRTEFFTALPPFRHECGTVACALGQGPAAGLEALPAEFRESWPDYGQRVFGLGWVSDEWSWCFGTEWSAAEPHARQAAARIRALLARTPERPR